MRRALAMFVEDAPHLIANSQWLYESWKYIRCDDTELVFMGTEEALRRLPGDVVKIVQRPAADDPDWLNYRFANSLACLNGEGASVLNDYDKVLKTDLDVFLTPAWNHFYPSEFTAGTGRYSHDECVRDNVRRIANKFGLQHRGLVNIGSTFYGPAQLVREVCELATELCKYIRTVEFKDDVGRWPSWFAGVSSMYATEIAVNHLVPAFTTPSETLDHGSHSAERSTTIPISIATSIATCSLRAAAMRAITTTWTPRIWTST